MIDALEPRRHLAATLTPAQTYATSLATPGAQKNWTIPLAAGQNVTLAAGDRSGSELQTELILIGPTGKVYRRSVGEHGSLISLNVPASGDWRVRLRDLNRDDTGSVQVTAFFYAPNIVDSDDTFPAESGRRRAADIAPGDLDVWPLESTGGQFLYAVASENTPGAAFDPGMLLIDPNGRVVGGGEDEKAVDAQLTNSLPGTYYAVVFDHGADDVGRYGIAFGRAPGIQYPNDVDAAEPLVPGVVRNGNMPGGDLDNYVLNLSAGASITATMNRTGGSLDPSMFLIDPTGTIVASAAGTPSATLNFTAQMTGNYDYYLVTRDLAGDDGGTYSLVYTQSG